METLVPIVLVVVALVVVGLLLSRARSRARQMSAASPEAVSRPTSAVPAGSPGAFRADGLASRIRSALGGGSRGEDAWRALTDALVKADVGPRGAEDLVARVRARVNGAGDVDALRAVRDEMLAILGPDESLHLPEGRLGVVLVVGVNGSGKTTTIGKLAARLTGQGYTVSLAGSDTFRAAAGEQLEAWAARSGAHLVTQDRGADPGAVAFDAVSSAQARGADVLIVDTAGRLHTKQPLMEELKKVKRVIEKAGASVDETLLVLDAQTGQNGIAQARAFTEAVDVTGVALTKTDGSAKGGIVLAVREELGVPIQLVGTGEGTGDLAPFDARAFVDRLLAG